MLIAEIGNCHYGSMDKAKLMIRIAHNCGADLIKAQAFRPQDIYGGSMPIAFYEQCALTVGQYIELIHYARDMGNDLFYSVFSKPEDGFQIISDWQNWHKVTGGQTRAGVAAEDREDVIVSIPAHYDIPKYKKASVLHVSEYLTTDPQLWNIQRIADTLDRPAGYSDHTIGITQAVRAYREYGANIIEKHFCMDKNWSFNGTIFRDSVHGADPKEFEQLAKELSR